jgi:arylsulfatase A-like enzyme
MQPVLDGTAEQIHDEIFAEVTFHGAYEPKRAVRTRRWKYIRHLDGQARSVLTNCDNSPSKTVWVEAGWHGREVAPEQLYDLVFDPNEMCNLAADPAAKRTLEEMRGRLDRYMKATDDPLLRGPVNPPEGHTLSDPDGISPTERMRV